MGLGAIASGATCITDEMFMAAAHALARDVSEADLAQGSLYPPLASIREVSAHIAATVARVAYEQKLATVPEPDDLLCFVKSRMYERCDCVSAGPSARGCCWKALPSAATTVVGSGGPRG